jgi:plasmid stabilization system protein ParE
MRVVFTQAALNDLDDILNYLQANFPTLIDPFERRVQATAARLSKWPESAPLTVERPGFGPPHLFVPISDILSRDRRCD